MSPKNAVILSPPKRREVIKENILKLDYAELAGLCNCTKRTIKRDVQKWRAEGGFEEFLVDEFLSFYPTMKVSFPEKAFDRLCYLLGKTMTRKLEAHTEHVETKRLLHLHMWMPTSKSGESDLPAA